MTAVEKWTLFFECAAKENYKEIFNTVMKDKEEIAMAGELLDKISQNTIDRMNAMSHEKALYRDSWNLNGARREGIAIGKKEAKKEGKEEGIQETKVNLARNFLGLLPEEIIAEKTGLSLKEVQELL